MMKCTRIASLAALLAVTLSGCGLSGWFTEKAGVGDAIAWQDMETEYEQYWAERERRKQTGAADAVFRPKDALEARFLGLAQRAEDRAKASNDLRFRAHFYHLAARAAIGAADYTGAPALPESEKPVIETKTSVDENACKPGVIECAERGLPKSRGNENDVVRLAKAGKLVCEDPNFKQNIRTGSAICLTMPLLAPVAILNAYVRKLDALKGRSKAEKKSADMKRWLSGILLQYEAFTQFDPNVRGKNESLALYKLENQKQVFCNLYSLASHASNVDNDVKDRAYDQANQIKTKISPAAEISCP